MLNLPAPLTLAAYVAAEAALHRELLHSLLHQLNTHPRPPKPHPLPAWDYELTADGYFYADKRGNQEGPLAYIYCTNANLSFFLAELTRSAGAVPKPPLARESYSRTKAYLAEIRVRALPLTLTKELFKLASFNNPPDIT